MAKDLELYETLSKVGLTKQETKVYLTLLSFQESKTGMLCKETKIASSNIYGVLRSLIQKGLVSYRIQNNIKIFMPSDPESLNELFKEKQRILDDDRENVQEIVNNLKIRKIEKEPESNYKYFEGFSGIKAMWHEINSFLDKTTFERIFSAKKESFERMTGFYDEHHRLRNKLNSKAKIIIPKELKSLAEKRKNKNTLVKLEELNNKAEWGIVDDNVYIQYTITKKPRGFLIKDKIFAETLKIVFDKIWEKDKKP